MTELNSDTVLYGYDALYRLTSDVRTGLLAYNRGYGYDLAGNLTTYNGSAFATYDTANKIATLSGGTVSHDADGNLTAVNGGGLPPGTFTWNAKSKLSSQTSGGLTISYGYNASGIRVWSQVAESPTRFHIFAGSNLIGEIYNGEPVMAYAWAGNRLISQRNLSADATLWYAFGPQGETRYLTDSTAAVMDSYVYSAYGVPVAATGTDYNPFRYGGRYGYYADGPEGLILAGQRWYSPQLTRWISRDPIKYEGGVNLYGYVEENPIAWLDPSGLSGLEYDDINNEIVLRDDLGNELARDKAYNNPNRWNPKQPKPFPEGRYPFFKLIDHPESDENGSYGKHGNFVFVVRGRTGMGVHSGRKSKGGPSHVTDGCIRTTDSFMEAVKGKMDGFEDPEHNRSVGPLTHLEVLRNSNPFVVRPY